MILKVLCSLAFVLTAPGAKANPQPTEKVLAQLLEDFRNLESQRKAALDEASQKLKHDNESLKCLESMKEVHTYLVSYKNLYQAAYVVQEAIRLRRKSKESEEALKTIQYLERPENRLWKFKELSEKVNEDLKGVAHKDEFQTVIETFNSSFKKLQALEARFSMYAEKDLPDVK